VTETAKIVLMEQRTGALFNAVEISNLRGSISRVLRSQGEVMALGLVGLDNQVTHSSFIIIIIIIIIIITIILFFMS